MSSRNSLLPMAKIRVTEMDKGEFMASPVAGWREREANKKGGGGGAILKLQAAAAATC